MQEPVLIAESLTKKFGDHLALDHFDLTINRGETLGLLGANGAGKTTAMNLLLGLTTPDSGSVRMFGLDFPKHRVQILRRVNFTSAYTNLPGNLLVRQNLLVFARLYRVPHPKQKIALLADMLEIGPLLGHVNGHLSAGESTRVNLCKALLNDPEVLLLDEPTASLDPDIADKVRTILLRIQRERNITMLYTSHNMKDIEEICDRVVFLKNGHVVLEGTPEEIMKNSPKGSLEDVFIDIARRDNVTRASA